MRRIVVAGGVASAVVAGVAAGAMFFGPLVTVADTPTAAPSASTSPSTGTTTNPPAPGMPGMRGDHGNGGPGGQMTVEAVTDTSVAANAIGISEADLLTALNNGQTIADVAKANNVDPQKVIDALVKDGQDELAAAVTQGALTQAQADAEQAEVTQRATDQVNGTFPMAH